jgi:hypothetical protein
VSRPRFEPGTSRLQARSCYHSSLPARLTLDLENRGSVFLLNFGWLLLDYVALQPDSTVGTATDYRLDDRGSILGRDGRFLSFPQRPHWLWGSPSLLSNRYRGALSWGAKRSMGEADHSSPSSAEVKNDDAIPPFSHMSPWRDA